MNNDLISRSALLEAMPKNDEIFSSEVRRVICNAPAVDADALLSGYDVRKVVEYDESGCGLDCKAVPVEAIETAPTIDAVEVVRCKDCVHRRPLSVDGVEPEVLVCVNKNMFPLRVKPDFYCAHGDRRDVKE